MKIAVFVAGQLTVVCRFGDERQEIAISGQDLFCIVRRRDHFSGIRRACGIAGMDRIGIAAASGVRARLEALDTIANNLANANTAGFKADLVASGLYPDANGGSITADRSTSSSRGIPFVSREWTDFAPGALVQSGSPSHIALTGKGFLSVTTGEGVLFTRNGQLQVSRQGQLVSADGLVLQSEEGGPITIVPSSAFDIRADGSVWQNGASVGRLRITEFQDPRQLSKVGGNYLRYSGPPEGAQRAQGTKVVQGAWEASNANPAGAAVQMVTVLRQFESLQKALQFDGEMSRRLLEEVAKV